MKSKSKLAKIITTSVVTISTFLATYTKLSEASKLPLDLPIYKKVSIVNYPVFMLEEYTKESEKQLGYLPKTWQEHILVTDSMTFSREEYKYQSDRDYNLAEMQRLLGMKVGDGNKVRWLFP